MEQRAGAQTGEAEWASLNITPLRASESMLGEYAKGEPIQVSESVLCESEVISKILYWSAIYTPNLTPEPISKQ